MTTAAPAPRTIALSTKTGTRFVYLTREGGPPTVVAERLWRVGCAVALVGDWQPAGCVHPDLPPGSRGDYFPGTGQRIAAADAKALGSGILKGLERYRRAESGVRTLQAHPRAADRQPGRPGRVWFVDLGPLGSAVVDLFADLNAFQETHPGSLAPDGEVIVALRELAADLKRGGDVTVSSEPPAGWYPPGTELALIEVLPAAVGGQRFRGRVYPPGARLEVSAAEANALVGERVRRLNRDGTPYQPPHACNCPNCREGSGHALRWVLPEPPAWRDIPNGGTAA